MSIRRYAMPDRPRKMTCLRYGVNNDLPFLNTDSEVIRCERVFIKSASDVVRYSFMVQKSVTYLDLSVGEFGKREKLCFTKDAFNRKLLNRRYIFYNYHLDVTWMLDANISALNRSLYVLGHRAECFYVTEVLVLVGEVYKIDFISHAKEKILMSNQKIRTLMKFLKLLNIQVGDFYPFLNLILEEQEDSDLVCKFLCIQPLFIKRVFLFNKYIPRLVDFVLYHTTRAKHRIINESISEWIRPSPFENFHCFYLMIKYGYNFPFFSQEDSSYLMEIIEYYLKFYTDHHNQQWRNFISSDRRRNLFAHTVFFYLGKIIIPPIPPVDYIQLMWLSISDPFLTYDELNKFCDHFWFRGVERKKFIEDYEYYTNSLECMQKLMPRSLTHLTRCTIRKHMGLHFQLPYGINKLLLPEYLKNYLRFNIPNQTPFEYESLL